MTGSDSSGLSSLPPNLEDRLATPTPPVESGLASRSPHGNNDSKKRKRTATQVESASSLKRARNTPSYTEHNEEEEVVITKARKATKETKRTPRGKATQVKVEERADIEGETGEATAATTPTKRKRKKSQVKDEAEEEVDADEAGATPAKVKRRRKTKEEKEIEAMPLAARTLGSKVLVGAHMSSAGGVHNAVLGSVQIGGNAFALFLKSQRKWENPPLKDEHLASFLSSCQQHKYGHDDHTIPPIVPHGSYLVNLAHPEPSRAKQAYDTFLDDLQRCAKLGIRLYNFHPGNCGASESRVHGIAHLAKQLNKAHKDPSSGNVITLLETMTSSTNVIGATFEDLAETINQIDDKERVGVCLDTCHVFSAGYDLRTPVSFNAVMDKFDKIIGLKYLKALHMNDSKAPLSSGRDLHANIGMGFLGLQAFHNIMNEPRLWGLPMVLETPVSDRSVWAREIKLLESLVGMDAESENFKKMEAVLHSYGQLERDRIQAQVDKKEAKNTKAKDKSAVNKRGKKKGKKADDASSNEESS